MKKPLFKQIESYKHKSAKQVLIDWLKINPELIGLKEIFKIKEEESQCINGNIIFCPDITIYNDKGVCIFIEIYHAHVISDIKLDNMYDYLDRHNWLDIIVIEINADWILNQTKQPDELLCQKYTFVNHIILDNLF